MMSCTCCTCGFSAHWGMSDSGTIILLGSAVVTSGTTSSKMVVTSSGTIGGSVVGAGCCICMGSAMAVSVRVGGEKVS